MASKINRRRMISTMGTISLGSLLPVSANRLNLNKEYGIKIKSIYTDILVVGGGTAGTIAAIQAGRAGSKTVLIESGSQLGGTATTGGVSFPGIFHAWGRQIIGGIGWEIVKESVELNGDKLPDFSIIPGSHWKHQVAVNPSIYSMLAEEKALNAGVQIRYYETPVNIEFKNDKWDVEVTGKGSRIKITCDQVIDCTGNALIASMAGFNVLREEDIQPGSFIFQIGGYDFDTLDLTKIPNKFHQHLRRGMLTNQSRITGENSYVPYGYVYVNGADSTTSESHTLANQQGRRNLLKLIRELRTFPGCENVKVREMKTETAVRETYRIDGLYKISKEDYVSGKVFDDSLSYSFYPVDLHRDGKSIYQEFLKPEIVASVPLRALIPKKSRNFIVAGRCVSSDRLANSGLRVQASCMGMGQSAAATAVLAGKMRITPAGVPVGEVKELLRKHGAIVPGLE